MRCGVLCVEGLPRASLSSNRDSCRLALMPCDGRHILPQTRFVWYNITKQRICWVRRD